MNTKLQNMAKILTGSAFVFLMLAVMPACAFDGATLSEIKISSKDNYSYKIILKTDKDIPVEKYVTSDNKIVIDLNNAKSAEFINTIYNNAPEIDNVIVQPVANDKIRIFIQGLNVASSKIVLDSRNETLDFVKENTPVAVPAGNTSSEPAAAVQNVQENTQKPPVINLAEKPAQVQNTNLQEPISQQYPENISQENSQQGLSDIETVKDSMAGGSALKKIFSKEGFDWLLRIFAVIFIGLGIHKFISKPKNVTIDLSSDNMKSREMELYRAANERQELLSRSIGSSLLKEKQGKKQVYGANSQYGIQEYRNSQLPPQRLSRPSENINSGINRAAKLNSALKTTRTAEETRKPAASNTRINQREIKTARKNVDNIKFLESMAAIYQKSGRLDLANNIRQSIERTKAAG